MNNIKTTLNQDANYFENGTQKFAVEYFSIDENGNAIDYCLDWSYFDNENDALDFINKFNN